MQMNWKMNGWIIFQFIFEFKTKYNILQDVFIKYCPGGI